mgnify:CR=1 FL=1
MMQNPVYSREMKVSSRSIRLPLIIVLFNGILSMVTLLNMYSAVAQVESTAGYPVQQLLWICMSSSPPLSLYC